jgi:Fe-S cluster assembly protein SufD
MSEIKQEAVPYISAFRTGTPDAEPDWLRVRREAAMQHFAALGFPTRNDEDWRFTNLRRLPKSPTVATPYKELDDAEVYQLSTPTYRLTLSDCRASPVGGLPPGVWFGTVAETLASRPDLLKEAFNGSDLAGKQPFASLNAALFKDGAVLAIDAGIVVEKPIEIVHANGGSGAYTRNLILLAEDAGATVLETHAGQGEGCNNHVTMIGLGAGANLRHAKLQAESLETIHLSMTRARLGPAASYESLLLSLGGFLSREDIQVALEGEGANFTLNGAYLLKGQQETTFAPFVDHQVGGCSSKQVVKGVAAGQAHGVFLGAITVRPGADQTDAHQTNRNLLLSDEATIDTRPELQILADDVKCSHGATVGDLDEASLFYLQARGIDAVTSRQLLIRAFAADILDAATLRAEIKSYMQDHLSAWLERLA